MNLLENCFKVIQNIPDAYFYRQENARILWEKSINAKQVLLSDISLYNKAYDPNKAYYEKWNSRNLRFASRTQIVLAFLDPALNVLFMPITLPLAAAKDLFLLLVKFPAFVTINSIKLFYNIYDFLVSFRNPEQQSELVVENFPQILNKPNDRFIRTSLIENILNTMSFSDVFNARIAHAKLISDCAKYVKAEGEVGMYDNFGNDQIFNQQCELNNIEIIKQYCLAKNNKNNYKINVIILKLESFFQTATAYLEIVPNALFFTAYLGLALVKDIFFAAVKTAFFATRKLTDFYQSFKYIINFINPPKDDPSTENSQEQSNDLNNSPRLGSERTSSPPIILPRFETPVKNKQQHSQSSKQPSDNPFSEYERDKNFATKNFQNTLLPSDNPFSAYVGFNESVSQNTRVKDNVDKQLPSDNPFSTYVGFNESVSQNTIVKDNVEKKQLHSDNPFIGLPSNAERKHKSLNNQ